MERLTELEKKVLREMLSYGYAFDQGNEKFLCYGVEGKKERGVIPSLIKKRIINVYTRYDETHIDVGDEYTIKDIVKISEYNCKNIIM